MKTRILCLTIFFVVILFGFESVEACSCGGGANPCGFYRAEGGVAFIGTVTNVVDANEKYGQPIKGKARKITIKVDEIFKGNLPNEVITSDDGFQCDNFPFKSGVSYLIYSKGILENTENILPVGLCSGTAPIENAQDSINFLRQLKEGKTPSILYGKVEKFINQKNTPNQPLDKTKIVLTKIYSKENGENKEPKKKDRKVTAFTDENGEYKFENLTEGRYKISAELPNGLWMQEHREFNGGGTPFCVNYPLSVRVDGRISGKISDADETAAEFLKLSLIPTNKDSKFYQYLAQTDKDGNYTFYGVPEGKYKISIYLQGYSLDTSKPSPFNTEYPFWNWYFPNTYHDSEAQAINLGNTEKLQNINLKMPPIPVRQTVSGIIVWEDETPVNKGVVSYRIKKLGDNYRRYAPAKEDGTFLFQIFDEFEYELIAANNDAANNGVSENWITLEKESLKNPLKLKIKPRK